MVKILSLLIGGFAYLQLAAAPPNVVFILVDDMGYGDLSIQEFGNLCEGDYIKAHLSNKFHRSELRTHPKLSHQYPNMLGVRG